MSTGRCHAHLTVHLSSLSPENKLPSNLVHKRHLLGLLLEYFGLGLADSLQCFCCLGFSGHIRKVLDTFTHFIGLLNLQPYIGSFIGFKFSATEVDFKA